MLFPLFFYRTLSSPKDVSKGATKKKLRYFDVSISPPFSPKRILLCAFAIAVAQAIEGKHFLPRGRIKSDDSDQYQTPSEEGDKCKGTWLTIQFFGIKNQR